MARPGIPGELLTQALRFRMPFQRQLFLSCCLLALCAGLCLSASAQPADSHSSRSTEAQGHAERGFEFARAGELEQAEAELRQAAHLAPANPDVLAGLGTVLAQQGKVAESTEVFRRVLKIHPHDVTVRRYLAANLWQLHLYPEAKEHLTIILRQQPNDKQAQLSLGMVSENTGDYATAARMLGSVPDQVGKQPESIAAPARSYYHLRQTDKARATLEPKVWAGEVRLK